MESIAHAFAALARRLSNASGSPAGALVAFGVVILWVTLGPAFHYSDTWQLIMNTTSSVVTFVMVFVLNNAQNRDTKAINTKLDALIHATETADNRAIALEEKTSGEVSALADEIRDAATESS